MELLNPEEVWRRIPPEEKLELLAKAHAQGIVWVFFFILITGTITIGLELVQFIWSALVISPFVFQSASSRKFRHLRPKTILEYLAARSAARRFALSANSKDLTVLLLFRGHLRIEDTAQENIPSFEKFVGEVREAPVWVALLSDAIVMLTEGINGANMELGKLLDDKISVYGESPTGESSYSNERELHITFHDNKKRRNRHFILTSQYSAALIVFEKKLMEAHEETKQIAARRQSLLKDSKSSKASEKNEYVPL